MEWNGVVMKICNGQQVLFIIDQNKELIIGCVLSPLLKT